MIVEREGKELIRWILRNGLLGRCPRCGEGKLFKSWLTLADKCNVCGQSYAFADPADGPAFFALSVVSFPLVFFAMWVELAFNPPGWVHLVTSGPLMLGGCVALLRPFKGWLVCSQYAYKAEEGRLVEPEERNR